MPPELLYVYGGVVVLGGATLLWSLGDGRAGNLMFDGGSAGELIALSICIVGLAGAAYLLLVRPVL